MKERKEKEEDGEGINSSYCLLLAITVKLSLFDSTIKIYQEPAFALLHSLSLSNVRIGIDLSPKRKQEEEGEEEEDGVVIIESSDLDEPFIVHSKC